MPQCCSRDTGNGREPDKRRSSAASGYRTVRNNVDRRRKTPHSALTALVALPLKAELPAQEAVGSRKAGGLGMRHRTFGYFQRPELVQPTGCPARCKLAPEIMPLP